MTCPTYEGNCPLRSNGLCNHCSVGELNVVVGICSVSEIGLRGYSDTSTRIVAIIAHVEPRSPPDSPRSQRWHARSSHDNVFHTFQRSDLHRLTCTSCSAIEDRGMRLGVKQAAHPNSFERVSQAINRPMNRACDVAGRGLARHRELPRAWPRRRACRTTSCPCTGRART